MPAILRTFLRRLLRDECGQSLIVTISSLTVLVGVAAFGIDTASWMVKHHDAQIVADAAAMAAAHCLANPGNASSMMINGAVTTVPACTSGTDTADAQTAAVDYAAANGFSIAPSAVNVNTTSDVVTVNATTHTPGVFSKVFGVNTTTQAATAGASYSVSPSSCSRPGSTCDFMFANSNNCNSGSYVLIVSTQGSSTINGDIQTNGSLDASATGNAGGINGTGTYGPGSCTSVTSGNHNPWNTSTPTQSPSLISWPINYSLDFPACGAANDPCQGNGYPSFCTNEGANITLGSANGDAPVSGNIYCASGTSAGVLKSDPSTWTGSITISSSGNNTFDDTFVAGTISYTGSGGDKISSCGYTASGYSSNSCSAPAPVGSTPNYPIFYAVDADPTPTSCAAGTNVSTTCAFSVHSTGNLRLDGDVFVENGTASLDFQGNQSAGNTFIEANLIGATLAGNFSGDGPSLSGGGGGTSGGGSVTLVQ